MVHRRTALAFLVITLSSVFSAYGAGHTIHFRNSCSRTIWVGMAGNAKPGGFYASGGWKMTANSSYDLTVDVGWAGRFFPRTGCTFQGDGNCTTQGVDCCTTGGCLGSDSNYFSLVCGPGQGGKPPASLFEFAFDAVDGHGIPYDTYDMSLVDGFNVPVQITPVSGTYDANPVGNPGFWCQTKGCSELPVCPATLKHSDGISCWSPCQYAVNQGWTGDKRANICCDASNITPSTQGACATAQNCENDCFRNGFSCSPYGPPSNDDLEKCHAVQPGMRGYWGDLTDGTWTTVGADAIAYVNNVAQKCGAVYSWQFRDADSTFTCRKTGGTVDYTVTFCPSP